MKMKDDGIMAQQEGGSIRGVGVSPGICCGRAVVLTDVPSDPSFGSDTPAAEPVILVGSDFSGEEVLSMDLESVCGFISTAGGLTASGGIVAKGAGIPGVMACPFVGRIRTGDYLILDGTTGEVFMRPSPDVVEQYNEQSLQYHAAQEEMRVHRHLPAETKDGWKVEVLAAVDLADAVPGAIVAGAGGIGLFRSEFYYLTGDGAPSEEFLFSIYQHVVSSIAPLPVTIRTLDLSGTTQIHGLERERDPNPALGLKGIRFSLAHPELFRTQLRALYRASAFGQVRILLPMVSSADELQSAKSILAGVRDELTREGVRIGDGVKVGLVLEVPAAVLAASHLASEVDFFSISSNDLIQYGLALDRVNGTVAGGYDPLDPGILKMIQLVVQAGHGAGIEVDLCGEMAGNPASVPLLLGMGLDSLSMSPMDISGVKKMVRESTLDQCAALAELLLLQTSSKDSNRCLQEYLHEHHSPLHRQTRSVEDYGRA